MKLKEMIQNKKFRYGANATILTALFILFTIVLNLIAGMITEKFPSVNLDLSENKQFQISAATKEAISSLDQDVKITIVLHNKESDVFYDEFLNRYRQLSNRITYSYVDPAKDPTAVQKYGSSINPYGSFVVESSKRFEVLDATAVDGQSGRMEEAEGLLTNAILSVTSEEEKKILFTKGHGEVEFKTLKTALENKFFTVSEIDLKQEQIGDSQMIVIAAPQTDFSQQELNDLDAFAKAGGVIQLYLNPASPYPANLCEYVKEWGIEVKNELIKENNNSFISAQNNGFIPNVINGAYTRGITDSILYPSSYRLDVLYTDVKGTVVTQVLTSTDQATTTVNSVDTGVAAKYNVALVSKRVLDDNSEIFLLVSGSPLRFDTDYNSQFIGNAQLASAVSTGLLNTGSYIEIGEKNTNLKALRLTNTQVVFVLVILAALSLGILIFGIVVWSRRRFL